MFIRSEVNALFARRRGIGGYVHYNKPEGFLAHAGARHVAVVVLDVCMERVTGLEILARLCALSPRTRVIALQIGPVAFS